MQETKLAIKQPFSISVPYSIEYTKYHTTQWNQLPTAKLHNYKVTES